MIVFWWVQNPVNARPAVDRAFDNCLNELGDGEDGVHGNKEWSRARGKDEALSFEHYQRKHKHRR